MLIDLTASDEEADELRRAPQRAQPHDLTASDDDADERQRAKRARLQAGSAAGGSGAPSTSAALPPPFKLLRTCAEVGAAPAHTATLEGLTAGEWEYALFSNYLICPAWLTSACEPLTRCPLVLLAPSQRAGGAVSRWANSTLGSERARVHLVCPPLPDQYGSHHAKFLLLFSKTGVRVVIHTANALYHDVRDMTQGVWSQDFPRRRGAPAAEGGACQFGRALVAYLREALRETPRLELRRAGGPPIAFSAESLLAYDFSGAEAHLLASVPGRHTGASLPLWGLAQLSALLRAEPAAAAPRGRSEPLSSEVCGQDEILLQFSSFSSVGAKAKFWHEMVGALSTQPATSGLPARPLRAHVVWPTEEEVRGCHLGYGGGGSLPAQRANVEKVSRSEEPALRGSLCTWTSPSGAHSLGRGRFTAHLKSYLRFDPDSRRVAWLVLTSANLSMAAWGTYEKQGSQLFIRSYELGVLLTPSTLAKGSRRPRFDCQRPAATEAGPSAAAGAPAAIAMVPMHEAATLGAAGALLRAGAAPLPLPYALPPPKYASADVPWVSSELRPGARRGEQQPVVHERPDHLGHRFSHAQLYGRDKDGRQVATGTD